MMTGSVNSDLEPRLPLHVQDGAGQAHAVEVVVDTGFNGFLTLPPGLVAALGLLWVCRQQGELADGSLQVFDVYSATVLWDGRPRLVEVDVVPAQPLLGTGLLNGYELRLQVKPGSTVTVAPAP
jgi:clan AA aspartic protease